MKVVKPLSIALSLPRIFSYWDCLKYLKHPLRVRASDASEERRETKLDRFGTMVETMPLSDAD